MKKEISRPGLIKRLAVIIYDGLLLAGLLFASFALIFAVFLIFPEGFNNHPAVKYFKFSLLIGVAFIYYGWFWVKGGQTLGMKAWHLYLVDEDGKYITWKTAAIRFATAIISWACLGLGFAWVLLSRKNLAWHDIASKTQIVRYKVHAEKKKKV